MVPPLSALSLALYHEALEGGGNHKMETSIANWQETVETSKWEPSNRKKKLPLLLTLFAIHCLTKASAFVPQCETYGISNWNQQMGTSKWEPSNRKKKLPLLLTLFAIHCLTKASAFVPQCKNIWSQQLETSKWEPVTGNQQMGTIKSQKETSPLAHFVRNSLPHKSFRFCSPMQKHMEPATGNHYLFVYLQCFGPSHQYMIS